MTVTIPMSSAPARSGDIDAPVGWKAFFPPAQWLPAYERRWLGADLVAGITLAAYAIPV